MTRLDALLQVGVSAHGFKLELLHHLVDDARLLHVLLASPLELLEEGHDHEGKLLVLVETNLDLFAFGCLLSGLVGLEVYVLSSPVFESLAVDFVLDLFELDIIFLDINITSL